MFKVTKKDKNTHARTGILETEHGKIYTPCFMPCGTLGTVKTTTPDELKELGVDILLGNTYHLYLRPGDKEIAKLGGLHEFMRWDGPILTDSGGYQVFSLGKNKSQNPNPNDQTKPKPKILNENCDIENLLKIENCKLKIREKNLVKINEKGVWFQSHIDGSKHFFTPEKVIDIQSNLGSDIMMVLDECTPYPCSKEYAIGAMERTHNWALAALEYHKSKISNNKIKNCDIENLLKIENCKLKISPLLFGIIQGSTFKDLREKSARFISSLPFDGIAIGGVAVGEGKQEMYKVIDWVMPIIRNDKCQISNAKSNSKIKCQKIGNLDFDIDLKFDIGNLKFNPRPIYLMGVGTPEDLLEGVERGIDMFDCVLPTRLARHATIWFYPVETRGRVSKKGGTESLKFTI